MSAAAEKVGAREDGGTAAPGAVRCGPGGWPATAPCDVSPQPWHRVSPGARWKVSCESTSLLRPMELAAHDHSPTIHGTMQGVTRITEGEAVLWECRLPFPNP